MFFHGLPPTYVLHQNGLSPNQIERPVLYSQAHLISSIIHEFYHLKIKRCLISPSAFVAELYQFSNSHFSECDSPWTSCNRHSLCKSLSKKIKNISSAFHRILSRREKKKSSMASIVYDEDRKASEENCNEGGGLEPVAKPMTEDDDDISAEEKARLARLTKLLEDCNAAEGKVWVKTDAALLRKLLVVAADPVKSDPSKSSMEGGGLEAGTKSVDSLDLSMAERRARYETKILPGGGVQIDPLLAAEIRARYEAIGKPRDWQPDPSSIAAERRARYGNMRICSERVDPSLAAESKAWFDESMQKIRQSLGFQADPGV